MIGVLAWSWLLVLASTGAAVTQIDESRFRVAIVVDATSPRDSFNAQIALTKAAQKHCKGKGVPVSEGTLNLDDAGELRRGRKKALLSEVYACRPAAPRQ